MLIVSVEFDVERKAALTREVKWGGIGGEAGGVASESSAIAVEGVLGITTEAVRRGAIRTTN